MVQGVTLEPVLPDALHHWWPIVKGDVDECRLRDTDDVWSEDVYAAIQSGRVFLYVGLDDRRQYLGMTIVYVGFEPHSKEKFLFVWMVNNHQTGMDILRDGEEHLVSMARNAGAKSIRYRADRLSFERLTRSLGYSISHVEMTKRI